jgi:hypothetical protein
MEVPESGLSTSSAASEVMNPDEEGSRVAGGLESNAGAQNLDVEPEIEQKKSFKFKLTIFMLCFISVVVSMASLLALSQVQSNPFSQF